MAEFPALPLWTDAYLGDTTHLSTIEHGAYLLILMAMWRADGSLPDDDRLLARYSKLTSGQWARISLTVRPFFRSENGHISQGRLTDELKHVRQHSMKQSNSARARWLKVNKTVDAVAMPDECHGNAPTPTPIKKDIGKPISQSDVDFAAFWSVVPKRIAKASARKAYLSALKRADAATILAGMTTYASSRKGQDATYTAHPATWLNADRWADETSQPEARSDVDRMTGWAKAIESGKDYLCRNIPASAARELVAQGRVTPDQCKKSGVSL